MNPDEYAAAFMFDANLADMQRERSRQADARRIGVSDLGVCHEQTRLMLTGQPFTDSPSRWPAMVGTWVHEGVRQARQAANPDLLTDATVRVTLPSGVELDGHPDEIDPTEPSVTDVKTKDTAGLTYTRKNHSSDPHRWQRHLYGLGAIQQSIVPEQGLIVRNIYLDRAGKDDRPHVEQEPFSRTVIGEADDFVRDVLYAVEHGEEASKDPAYSWCAKFCEFFTACRKPEDRLEVRFTQPELILAARTFHDASETWREAGRVREHAKALLVESEVDGLAGQVKVRRSWVNGNDSRSGYWNVTSDLIADDELSQTAAGAS